MTEICLSCGKVCADFTELARHIAGEKKGHAKGKIWAARYLTKVRMLNQKKDLPQYVPMTEEQKENRRNLGREVSGDIQVVLAVCPKCKQGHREALPVEYVVSLDAWRSPSGKIMRLCAGCVR